MQQEPHTAPGCVANGNESFKILAWCVAGLSASTVFFVVLDLFLKSVAR